MSWEWVGTDEPLKFKCMGKCLSNLVVGGSNRKRPKSKWAVEWAE
jgi:hypothetical protein